MKDLREKHSRQVEQQVQRPWGKNGLTWDSKEISLATEKQGIAL